MTKRFCDLCGNAAIQDTNRKFMASENYGPKYTKFGTFSEREEQCVIRVAVYFSFQNHECGFCGSPDLCEECAKKLISKLLEKKP